MTVTWTLRAGLKWSDGEPLTCDDFNYAWEWVLDPDNVGVITAGYQDITRLRVRLGHRDGLALHEDLRGLHHPLGAPLPPPLSRDDSDRRPGQRRRLPAGRDRQHADQRRVQVRVGYAEQELRLAKNPNYTSFATGKPAHLDTLIWKWYGDADLMIAGFKANEVDFATDLQDSDIPKVQDLGEQVSAIPALLYEFLRPNWSEGPFDGDQDRWLLAQPDGPGPRRGLPDGRPGHA